MSSPIPITWWYPIRQGHYQRIAKKRDAPTIMRSSLPWNLASEMNTSTRKFQLDKEKISGCRLTRTQRRAYHSIVLECLLHYLPVDIYTAHSIKDLPDWGLNPRSLADLGKPRSFAATKLAFAGYPELMCSLMSVARPLIARTLPVRLKDPL